jgi:hypothetical protein
MKWIDMARLMCLATMLAATLAPAWAWAGDRYFLVVYATETSPNRTRTSHTFATFVRKTTVDGSPSVWESHTISWLPQTLVIRPLALRPEAGINLGLHESIAWARQYCASLSIWGPYEITPCLYERALARAAELESGCIRYVIYDHPRKPNVAVDCIHALAGAQRDDGLLTTGLRRGSEASYRVLLHFSSSIIDAGTTHDEVLTALGLDQYQFCRRTWDGGRLLRYQHVPPGRDRAGFLHYLAWPRYVAPPVEVSCPR